MAEAKKPTPKKSSPKKATVDSKKTSAKKTKVPKKSTVKKTAPKAVKSVEKEIEEAAMTAVKTTKIVAKKAVSQAKKALEDAHLDERIQSAEKAGKKAFASAKKTIQEAHIEETSKKYISQVGDTLKKLGAKISYKARGLEEVPTAAGKSISSALIAGKASAKRSMQAMGITKKEPPKQKIFGLEISDEMFRAIVLIFLLVVFFYLGMIFGQMKTYHHIEKKLYKMGTYEKHMKYDRDDMMQERINFPVQDAAPEIDAPEDFPVLVPEIPPFIPEPPEVINPVGEEVTQ